jgi:hypothetical protein
VKVNITDNKLLLWGEEVASRSDDRTENCTVSLKFNGKEIQSWDTINWAGKLSLTVTDSEWKSSNKEITVTNEPIKWLENLKNLNMQVDKEVDLLKWISFPNWVELVKVEIEIDGHRYEVSDPNHYIPQYPWTCNIIFTVKWNSWNIVEVKSDTLTIKWLEYNSININNIDPESLVPQVEVGDKDVYKHIEHLRIPESTRIVDMMWEYWAGNYTPEQYQKLMMRLNTGMMEENPIWCDNYEIIWWELVDDPSSHAHIWRYILNSIIKHANFKVINSKSSRDDLYALCKSDPTKMNIMWLSLWSFVNKNQYDARQQNKEHDKEKNLFVFCAWWNICYEDWYLINKICQEDYALPDKHSAYGVPSRAHKKTDTVLDRHIATTIATDETWDIDQTNEQTESSVFPIWFHDKVLFSWRIFSYKKNPDDKVRAPTWKYNTSFTNYVNVAMMALCFQMYAEVEDIDELLEMVRSTCLTDYIRLDWQTQALQLMNPAWFFKKYLMPRNQDIPSSIQPWELVPLKKGYYKWVLFDIPWAEVKINWKWIAYNKENETQIKSQNPMNLEWRLNWDLVAKYNKDWSVIWKIIAVDDERNGLNLDVEGINIMIERSAQRSMVDIPFSIRSWETIMLTNWSNKWVIYDIPWAQPYIKWKSWIEYNKDNKDLVMNQNLKDLPWRLNWDLAMKYSKDWYIKWTVYAINDTGKTIDQREVTINIEDFVQNNNRWYMAQWYTKTEWNYIKDEWNYKKSEKGYIKAEGNYKKSEWTYKKYAA